MWQMNGILHASNQVTFSLHIGASIDGQTNGSPYGTGITHATEGYPMTLVRATRKISRIWVDDSTRRAAVAVTGRERLNVSAGQASSFMLRALAYECVLHGRRHSQPFRTTLVTAVGEWRASPYLGSITDC